MRISWLTTAMNSLFMRSTSRWSVMSLKVHTAAHGRRAPSRRRGCELAVSHRRPIIGSCTPTTNSAHDATRSQRDGCRKLSFGEPCPVFSNDFDIAQVT